ncbi:MAG: FtsX-like permease family protein, partial [bacterium]|nr:FtsX-like permease family protein [bacterium]
TPNWGRWTNYTYILLKEGYDYRILDNKINEWAQQYVGPIKDQANIIISFFLQPLTSIHLNSDLRREMRVNGSIGYIYAFALTAAFILLIACINFMNLSTARSSKRAREVGMRKVFGAYKRQLIVQFLGESFLYTLISLVLALIMIELLEPLIKANFNSNISVNYLEIPVLTGGVVFILVFVGLFAGSYPAFFLSKFNSINVLKGNLNLGAKHSAFRKVLVTSQFAISIGLIIGTGIILNQVNYMKDINLGFDKEQLLILPASGTSPKTIETAKQEMLRIPGVFKAAKSNVVPGRRPPGYGIYPEGHEGTSAFMMEQINIEPDFLDTYQMEIAEGRGFSEEMMTDTSAAFMVNETAVKQFGWTDPVGKKINSMGREYTVIGVLKDFHQQSLHYRIEGTLFRYFPHSSRYRGMPYNYLTLKVETENITATMQKVESKFRELYPDREYSYFFLDENYDSQYAAEDKLSQVIELFTGLAIFIGCLGLFGLASFTAQQRTKEIGIRKVLGSSIGAVTLLLYKEFTVLVLLAITIAWPLTYFFMKGWIQSFAYQSEIGISVFILGAALAVLIALVTVSYQSIKAAMTNPVDTLRYE